MAFHAGSLNAQSHGCIHLSTAAAKMFFNSLSVGDVVQVVP
jgi:lipoprotein-anchoring transpeptidase ErfK/SrfK